MRDEWPETVTPQQRAATEELLRRLYYKYPERILAMVLFGSVARGDFTPDSDIDVLVVVRELDSDLKGDLRRLAARVSLDFDVLLNLHIYPRAVWDQLREQGKALWRNVERDGIELTPRPIQT